MTRNIRDKAADELLADNAHRVVEATFANFGSKTEPQWVVVAPTSEIAAMVTAGAGIVRTSQGADTFVAPIALVERDGALKWTMFRSTDDVAVECSAVETERLNIAPRVERVTWSFEPRKPRAAGKVDGNDIAALRARLAELEGTGVAVTSKGRAAPTAKTAPAKAVPAKTAASKTTAVVRVNGGGNLAAKSMRDTLLEVGVL